MKKTLLLISGFILMSAAFYDKDKDPLNKRIFNTTVTEIKAGVSSNKTIKDELEFKNNRLFSKFLNEKFDVNWMNYTITKDTTYTDSVTEAEIQYFEVKALYKDADNQETHVFCKIENELIEGNIKIMKNDKLKKEFEFSGQEKATKINDKKK